FASEIGQGRRRAERALRFAQPSVRFPLVAEDPFRKLRHAREPHRPIGFLDRERLAALYPASIGAARHYKGENFVLRIAMCFERAKRWRRRPHGSGRGTPLGRDRLDQQGFAVIIGGRWGAKARDGGLALMWSARRPPDGAAFWPRPRFQLGCL